MALTAVDLTWVRRSAVGSRQNMYSVNISNLCAINYQSVRVHHEFLVYVHHPSWEGSKEHRLHRDGNWISKSGAEKPILLGSWLPFCELCNSNPVRRRSHLSDSWHATYRTRPTSRTARGGVKRKQGNPSGCSSLHWDLAQRGSGGVYIKRRHIVMPDTET
jgi:hypothetical protein